MKNLIVSILLLFCFAASAQSLSGVSLGVNGNLNGWLPGTSSNPWRVDVSAMPLDSTNSAWQSEMGGAHLHADFGSYFGIPYNVVDNTTPYVRLSNTPGYANQSDITALQVNSSTAIEGGHTCPSGYVQDDHGIVLNRDTGYLFETYNLYDCPAGFAVSDSMAVWDTTIDEARPWGWTSVDAAGLSVFMGLLKYDEANSGTINHAIRFTTSLTKCANPSGSDYTSVFVLPGTHGACNNGGTNNVMGMRIRLQASFSETPYASYPRLLAIIHAMKKYGMILADNGSNMYISGTNDPRWTDSENSMLAAIYGSSFEVVQQGTLYDVDHVPTGTLPTVSTPTISPSAVFLGQCATVSWTSSGSSYDFVQNGLPSRSGSSQVCPSSSSTYVVQTSNQYGRTTSSAVPLTVMIPPFLGAVYQGSLITAIVQGLFGGNVKLQNVRHN